MKALNAVARQKMRAWSRQKLLLNLPLETIPIHYYHMLSTWNLCNKFAHLARICPRHLVEEEQNLNWGQFWQMPQMLTNVSNVHKCLKYWQMSQAEKTFVKLISCTMHTHTTAQFLKKFGWFWPNLMVKMQFEVLSNNLEWSKPPTGVHTSVQP